MLCMMYRNFGRRGRLLLLLFLAHAVAVVAGFCCCCVGIDSVDGDEDGIVLDGDDDDADDGLGSIKPI